MILLNYCFILFHYLGIFRSLYALNYIEEHYGGGGKKIDANAAKMDLTSLKNLKHITETRMKNENNLRDYYRRAADVMDNYQSK